MQSDVATDRFPSSGTRTGTSSRPSRSSTGQGVLDRPYSTQFGGLSDLADLALTATAAGVTATTVDVFPMNGDLGVFGGGEGGAPGLSVAHAAPGDVRAP